MKKHAMLDGFKAGTDLGVEKFGVEIQESMVENLWKAMERTATVEKENARIKGKEEIGVVVNSWFVSLRKSWNKQGVWFMNLSGNPATEKGGNVENVYGTLTPVRDIVEAFLSVVGVLRKNGWRGAGPVAVEKQVRCGNIHLHSLTFAVYTKKKSKETWKKLLNAWYAMYETRVEKNGELVSLLRELGMQRLDGEEYKFGIGLGIKSGTNFVIKCSAYVKSEEVSEKKPWIQMNNEMRQDLDDRLRMDLTLTNFYLTNILDLKKATLRELYKHAQNCGGWNSFLGNVWLYWLERSCMQYMFTCKNVFREPVFKPWVAGTKPDKNTISVARDNGVNLRVSPHAHAIMLYGRQQLTLQKNDVYEYLGGGDLLLKKLAAVNVLPKRLNLELEL